MAEVGWLLAIWVSIYLLTGALVGPIVVCRLAPYAAESRRNRVRSIALFLSSTRLGLGVTIIFWPVVLTVYRLGFFLSAWDWKGTRTRESS
jgi:ABC-type glycerol-3-phosphate transport system permease component